MHVVVIKYIQLLCITVFFTNNVGCDELILRNDRAHKELYLIAACMAECVRDDPKMEFESCYRTCNERIFNTEQLQNITNSNIFIRLICRDETGLVIKIENFLENATHMRSANDTASVIENVVGKPKRIFKRSGIEPVGYYESDSDRKHMNEVFQNEEKRVFIYLVTVQSIDGPKRDNMIYVTNSSMVHITKLMPDKRYNISVTVTTSNYEYAYGNGTQQYSTLTENYKPATVAEILLERYALNKTNNKTLIAYITWTPAPDMTCHYEILCFSPESREYDLVSVEIRKPEDLYRHTITELNFGAKYEISIRGKHTKNITIEGDFMKYLIETPTCLDWFKNDINVCDPPHPDKINILETFVSENNYDVNISWDKQKLIPNYYVITIFDTSPPVYHESFIETINVTGNATEARFSNVILNGLQYELRLTAYSNGGHSTLTVERHIDRNLFSTNRRRILRIIIAVIGPIFLLAMVLIIIILICHRRAKLKRYEERCRYFEELEQKAPIDPNSTFNLKTNNIINLRELETALQNDMIDCALFINDNDNMEVPRSNIKILGILGEGAFGLVKKGILIQEQGIEREVAVKMLKDNPSTSDYLEFRREIEVMKSVGSHCNIVGFIGHCTRNKSEMMLLTEYCCKGNLLHYLRLEWEKLSQKSHIASESRSQLIQALYSHNSDQDHHNKNTVSDADCHTPSLASQNTPESVFNFDTSLVDKSFKYKNVNDDIPVDINDTDDSELTTGFSNMNGHQLTETTTTPYHLNYVNGSHSHTTTDNNEFNTTNLIINKLYDEYISENTNCTNSCKCNVEIYNNNNIENVSNNNDSNDLNMKINYSTIDQTSSMPAVTAPDTQSTKINIKDCECYKNSNSVNNNNNRLNSNNSSNNLNHNNKKLNKVLKNSCDKTTTATISGSQSQLLCDNSNGSSNNSDSNNSNGNQTVYSNININNNNNVEDRIAHHLSERLQLIDNKWNEQFDFITSEDLLSFAKQICSGMEFLSRNKVVHRDLAARNVLVAADKTVKIADFGLSRDIYQDNIYKKTGNGKLPIKWLALESMTHQIYTSQSDVWSYGILLYEIVTLGGSPYPAIPTNRLLKLLKSGYRMKKPLNCSEDIYNLMYSCWNANPQSRPTFSEILEKLEQRNWDSVNLEVSSEKQRSRSSKSTSSEPYLRPIKYTKFCASDPL